MNETHTFDAIVIGSGLGGLVSAVILAKEGMKVCVLEKNNQFGGNLQTFSRDKKVFDTGVHYLGGLDRWQNLYRYFSYVGIMDKLKLEKMPPVVDEICFGANPLRYPIAQSYPDFVQQLTNFFPKEQQAIKKYVDDLKKVCDSFPLYNVSDVEGYTPHVINIGLKAYMDELTKD